MPDDEIDERIADIEEELADLKAIRGADEDLREQAETEPYGLARLQRVKRKETYPERKDD